MLQLKQPAQVEHYKLKSTYKYLLGHFKFLKTGKSKHFFLGGVVCFSYPNSPPSERWGFERCGFLSGFVKDETQYLLQQGVPAILGGYLDQRPTGTGLLWEM